MTQHEEIECKFLGVDVADIQTRLAEHGAELEFERLFRRTVFDYEDKRLNSQAAWLRVRDEGDRVTISYKQRLGVQADGNDAGMKEVEIDTQKDFDIACELFVALGFEKKFYEENRRAQYKLDGVEICIDEWPLLDPYVEVEGESWEAVQAVAEKLGFIWEDRKIYSTMQIYENQGINESDYQVLTFDKQIKK